MGLVCSMLMVLIHTGAVPCKGGALWWVYSIVGQGMATIAVPWFFLVSGYMLGGHLWDDGGWVYGEVGKRIRSLAIPFVLWNLLFVAFRWAMVFSRGRSAMRFMLRERCQRTYMVGLRRRVSTR